MPRQLTHEIGRQGSLVKRLRPKPRFPDLYPYPDKAFLMSPWHRWAALSHVALQAIRRHGRVARVRPENRGQCDRRDKQCFSRDPWQAR